MCVCMRVSGGGGVLWIDGGGGGGGAGQTRGIFFCPFPDV